MPVGASQRQPPLASLPHTPSAVHDWQVVPVPLPSPHRAVRQSVFTAQVRPLSQAGQSGPPQSTPVSRPFLTPSVQVGPAGTAGDGGGEAGGGAAAWCLLWCLCFFFGLAAVSPVSNPRSSIAPRPPVTRTSRPRRERGTVRVRIRVSKCSWSMRHLTLHRLEP